MTFTQLFRAEILHRCRIRPFDRARDVLSSLTEDDKKDPVKNESGDVLETTRDVMLEVINLTGNIGYKVPSVEPDAAASYAFEDWLRCYDQDGMKTLTDGNKRTVWFAGEAGAMAPKGQRPKIMKREAKKSKKENGEDELFANGAKKRKKVPKVKEEEKEAVNGTRTSKRRSSSRIAAAL